MTDIDAPGLRALLAGFLATRTNTGTREAYRRDLVHVATALGAESAIPDDDDIRTSFGVEDDPGARAAAQQLSRLGIEWWQRWRDRRLLGVHGHEDRR